MLVVFDLDGTVVDSTRALLGAHEAAWASVGKPRPSDETILNLIGLGLGPLIVGALSDRFTRAGFETPLATAMLICGVIGALWACLHYVLAANNIRRDIARLEQ